MDRGFVLSLQENMYILIARLHKHLPFSLIAVESEMYNFAVDL